MLLLRAFIILVKFLTVEECFALSSLGLVITPHFPMPKGRWESFSAPIIIEQPHGHQIKAEGHFHLTHFNIPDTQASLDQCWQVALAIKKSVTKNHIPKGSIILIAEVDAHKILFGN